MIKLIKSKEIITKEIEVIEGVYYFALDSVCHKIEIVDDEFKMEALYNFTSPYGIRITKDYVDEKGFELPYQFKRFILSEAGKEITKEEFDLERQEILNRLNK